MFYLKAFFNSLYNLSWLRAQKNNGKQGANYIVLFIIVLSVVYAGYFTQVIPSSLRTVIDEAFNQVPDFRAEFKEGKLHVDDTVVQPYIFEYENPENQFTIVLDTVSTSSLSLEDVQDEEDTYTILITSDQVMMHEQGTGKTTIQSFVDVEDMRFTKQDLRSVVDSFLNNTWFIFVLLLIFWFVIFAFGRVVYLLFLSLLVFAIAKFFKSGEWKFSQVYTIGLFALTLPSIIVALLALANMRTSYLFSVLTLAIISGVVFVGKDEPVDEAPIQAEHTDISS